MKSLPGLLLSCAVFVSGDLAIATQAGGPGIEGTVLLAGSAFSGTEVVASSAASGQFWETSTDSLGRYVLEGLPPGRYTVWAEASGHGCIVFGDITVKPGVRVHRDFRFAKNKTYPGCESITRKRQR
ncbi:MAG: carboxypeptidase-like regulatory domain-containing protein [Bryobacteraceae bacterium]